MNARIAVSLSTFMLMALTHLPVYAGGSATMVSFEQFVNDDEGDYFIGQGDELKVVFASVFTADGENNTQFRFVISWSNNVNHYTDPVTVGAGQYGLYGDEDFIIAGLAPYYEFGIDVEWKYPEDTEWNNASAYNWGIFSSD